jgi:uncharacterized membrane protein YphA (DoxX/SURF4 family)
VQRLFSMFPTGLPGIALLLLRVVVAATFLLDGTANWTLISSAWILVLYVSIAADLCAGALTPYFAILIIILDLWAFHSANGKDLFHLAISILISGIVALLGPGAYSVDARVFGRRLIVLPPAKRS